MNGPSFSIAHENVISDDKHLSGTKRKFIFYLWMLFTSFWTGTKMVLIGSSKLNEEWVFLFENLTILIGSWICYAILRFGVQRYSEERKKLFTDKRLIICTLVSGISTVI